MFREYSNTPYLAGLVGLRIFWYRHVYSQNCMAYLFIWFSFHFSCLCLFVCFWKCFYIYLKRNKTTKKRHWEKYVQPTIRVTGLNVDLSFSNDGIHVTCILFSHIHETKTHQRFFLYYLFDMGQEVCMRVFVSVFSALTIPWNRLEIGVLSELYSYLDSCVVWLLYLGENCRLEVSSLHHQRLSLALPPNTRSTSFGSPVESEVFPIYSKNQQQA